MPRRARSATGGSVCHVLNRANARATLFEHGGDYLAFERVLSEALERLPMRLLAYCIMPTHWHFVLWPKGDDHLAEFMRWLTVTHVKRWHAYHQTVGSGHLYQGRYKSFPIQTDEHFLTVCRYVERNAVRARLVDRAEQWRWSSLWWMAERRGADYPIVLADWPMPRPRNWLARINQPLSQAELSQLRLCVRRGRPYGATRWTSSTAQRFDLESTLRPLGRPRSEA